MDVAGLGLHVLTLPVFLMIQESSDIVISVGIDKSSVSIHLIVLDLPFVNSSIVDNIPADALDVALLVQLPSKMRELDRLAAFCFVIYVLIGTISEYFFEPEHSQLSPFLLGLHARLAGLRVEELEQLGVYLRAESFLFDLYIRCFDIPKVKLLLEYLLLQF